MLRARGTFILLMVMVLDVREVLSSTLDWDVKEGAGLGILSILKRESQL
jgi:hypothetical protein